jgi:transcriptional regulator with XRE-family HTH domain
VADTTSPLGDFLRARRALVDPVGLGLPDYGRRRSTGLRREELALLAGVSAAYYARLEQGRDRHPSPQVLDAIGSALALDDELLAHLHRLAEPAPARRPRQRRPERLGRTMELLMASWSAAPGAVVVVAGRYRDVLAATPVAALVNPGWRVGRNLLRDVFLDEEVRRSYLDLDDVTHASVAGLRAAAGSDLDDPRLTELVGELSLKSEAFRTLWARHEVRIKTAGTKRFDTQLAGRLDLHYQSFSVHGADRQTCYVYLPEPGSPHERTLALLTGLAADRAPAPTPR